MSQSCRSEKCGAGVVWARLVDREGAPIVHRRGKKEGQQVWVILDAEPFRGEPQGDEHLYALDPETRLCQRVDHGEAGRDTHQSHWQTCADAERFARKKKR